MIPSVRLGSRSREFSDALLLRKASELQASLKVFQCRTTHIRRYQLRDIHLSRFGHWTGAFKGALSSCDLTKQPAVEHH